MVLYHDWFLFGSTSLSQTPETDTVVYISFISGAMPYAQDTGNCMLNQKNRMRTKLTVHTSHVVMIQRISGLSLPTCTPDRSFAHCRCGNNYGWVRFEGTRCTEFSEDAYGPCSDADRGFMTPPIFEYCHYDYDSSIDSEAVYTGDNDLCGDRTVEGNTVIGKYSLIARRLL